MHPYGSSTPDAGEPASRIVLVMPFYGRWPAWMPAFLASCGANPDISFLLVSDLVLASRPPNVRLLPLTFDALKNRAGEVLGVDLSALTPYKICDLRPSFGEIFAGELHGFDYWGHADLDIIWGRIRHGIAQGLAAGADVISTRPGKASGHFTLYRNRADVNALYRADERFLSLLAAPASAYLDEVWMTNVVRRAQASGKIRVYWPASLVNFPPTGRSPANPSLLGPMVNRWEWEEGRLYHHARRSRRAEVMYLHFMTWKSTLLDCDISPGATPSRFWISFSHIAAERSLRERTPWLEFLRRWLRVVRVVLGAKLRAKASR